MFEGSGNRKPLGWGERGEDISGQLKEGEEASFWDPGHPHDGHTDAILYRKQGGRIYEIDRMHINSDGSIRPD